MWVGLDSSSPHLATHGQASRTSAMAPRRPARLHRPSSFPAPVLQALCLGLLTAGQKTVGSASAQEAPRFQVSVLDKPTEARTGVPLAVAVRVTAVGGGGEGVRVYAADGGVSTRPIVRLHYRAMFGEERSVVMEPKLGKADEYAASVPAQDLPGYGQMVRYWIVAKSADGVQHARKPSREDDFYGAVQDAAAVAAESPLPTLHWFVEDTNGALWDNPVQAFVAFDPGAPAGKSDEKLRFYGKGVTVRRRGSGRRDGANMWGKSGSKDWPKRKFKLDFRGRDFKVTWEAGSGLSEVEEVNLHSSYDEPGPESYLRESLAAAAFKRVGVPAPAAKHIVLRQNGDFYGLYVMVENVDVAFLERHGYDPSGPLFKAVHWKYSNLRPAAASWKPCTYASEWDWSWGPCPEVYRHGNKDRIDEWAAKGELQSLLESLDAVNSRGDTSALWAAVEVDTVVKEMAAQTAMLHQDRCAKNYYMFKSRSSGKWLRIPWDMEDAFATDYRNSEGRCDAGGATACRTDSDTYCVQSCEWWNSPFFCDAQHPQDIFHESDGRSTWNHLVNAVLVDGGARTGYLRELKRQLHALHFSGWLEDEARALGDRIRGDANRDSEKWGIGNMDRGLEALVRQMRERREILSGNYGRYWVNL